MKLTVKSTGGNVEVIPCSENKIAAWRDVNSGKIYAWDELGRGSRIKASASSLSVTALGVRVKIGVAAEDRSETTDIL
jgi:hypothetical protein